VVSGVRGAREMMERLWQIAAKFPDRVGAALYQEAQIEMTEAKRRTPVATGALRASGRVAVPVRRGQNISVTLSFGGAAIDYAIYVHENLDAWHGIPPFHGGQAKFLESVLTESAPYMAARIARRVHFDRGDI